MFSPPLPSLNHVGGKCVFGQVAGFQSLQISVQVFEIHNPPFGDYKPFLKL